MEFERGTTGRRAFLSLLALIGACVAACDGTPAQRRTAIYDLRDDPTPSNVDAIRTYLDDTDRDVRATALNVLVGLEVPDAPDLSVEALGDADGFVRATAAKLLGDTRDSRYVGVLAERLLEDPDAVVRQRSAEALTRVDGDGAAEALAQGILDPMEQVRLAAVEGLTKLGPDAATAGLVRLLLEDPVWEVRARAARALGGSRDDSAVTALEEALGDENEFVRSAATNALRLRGYQGRD